VVDEAHVDLGFASGLHAHVAASWLHPFKEQRLVVIGETGALVFDDLKPWPEKLSRRAQRVIRDAGGPIASGEAPVFVDLAAEPPLVREIRHFLQCCDRRLTPRTDIDEAMRVQRVLDEAQSLLTSLPV
jgi:predicted dehydrogenase